MRATRSSATVLRGGLALAALLFAAGLWWTCRAPLDPTLFPPFDPAAAAPPPPRPPTPPRAGRSVFFGDLHIHTALSLDAYLFGVRAGPEDAYVFARGGAIAHGAGYAIQLSEPLDFAAVTDHAEYLGMFAARDAELPLSGGALRTTLLRRNRLLTAILFLRTMNDFFVPGQGDAGDPEVMRGAWRRTVEAAERANDPGVFTSFVGYEWTSMRGPANLHRNVIYRGAAVPDLPFSADDSADPEDLWRALEEQARAGMDAIAIPHNANVSDGLMFAPRTLSGAELDADYAARRTRFEPLQEIFQVKGASETHPSLSPDDAFADFEIKERTLSTSGKRSEPDGSYARQALVRGLSYRVAQGFDPFDFGVIGSSDGHGASAPVEEDRFHGKLPLLDGSAGIRLGAATLIGPGLTGVDEWGSGGLAAIWATENTREALFAAMRRRETYATSGTRLRVRFFAGWGYPDGLLERPDAIARADAGGVPMGAPLPPPPPGAGHAPDLLVWAQKDPRGANLDRIQIVKLWVDASGAPRERVFDVAASDARVPDADGRVPPLPSTVDVARARYSNDVGAAELRVQWRDPAFDPTRPCRYYARVLEIRTPRWSTYDARALGIAAPEPATLQERAVTSAITYLPAALSAPASASGDGVDRRADRGSDPDMQGTHER